jgi:hypothetical protein
MILAKIDSLAPKRSETVSIMKDIVNVDVAQHAQ